MLAISGWWMIIVAQGWLVLELTDSAFWVATASATLSVPFLLLGPVSGVVADRFYRKALLVATRSTIAMIMLVEGILIATGAIELWQILALGFLAGCAFAMDIPARQSLIPDTVPVSVVPNAVAINVSVFSIASIGGPIAGAAMLAAGGAGGCFMANAAGNLALALAILAMRIPRRRRAEAWDVVGEFIGGLRFVRTSPVVLLLLLVALVTMLGTSAWRQLAPVFVRDVYGSSEAGLGALYTAAGVGAVVGAPILLWLSRRDRRAAVYGTAVALNVASVVGFAASPVLGVAVGFALLNGLAMQLTDATGQTVLLIETPEELRGRAMSLWSLLWGVQPAGTLAAGLLAEALDPQAAIASMAIVSGLVLAIVSTRMRHTWKRF